MASKSRPNKKRKLDDGAVEESFKSTKLCIAELILSSDIDDIFGTKCMSTSQLDELTKKRLMDSINFANIE